MNKKYIDEIIKDMKNYYKYDNILYYIMGCLDYARYNKNISISEREILYNYALNLLKEK